MKTFLNISKKDNSIIKIINNQNNLSIIKNVNQNKKNPRTKEKELSREFGKELTNYSNLTKCSKLKGRNYNKHSSDILSSKLSKNSINLTHNSIITKVNKITVKKGFKFTKLEKKLKPFSCIPNEKQIVIKRIITVNPKTSSDLMDIDIEEKSIKTIRENQIIKLDNKKEIKKEKDNEKEIEKEIEIEKEKEIEKKKEITIENKNININPQLVEEYLDDIYEHLKSIETNNLPKENYMESIQNDITERMRLILLDWLIDVHLKFKLLPETLFLTINIIDRYLSIRDINRKYLQLLGICSMFIACKYEEIYWPEIKSFIYMTDNAYEKNQMINMENDILKVLEFNIVIPSSLRFLEIYKQYLKFDNKFFFLCRYLIEVALIDYKLIKYKPSFIASSAVFIGLKMYKKDNISCSFDENLLWEITNLKFEDIKDCIIKLIYSVEKMEKGKYLALKRKFSHENYMCISKYNLKFNENFLL